MAENKPGGEVLLVNKAGALILQHRDNKPNINNPDMLTTFGGSIEEGESPIEGALRELKEETNLNLRVEDVDFFGKYPRTMEADGQDEPVHCFIAKNIDESKFKVHEGQGFKIINSMDELMKNNPAPFMVRIAKDYFERRK